MSSKDDFANRSYPVEENMQLQRRQWLIERAGWCGLCLVTIAALLGLFGTGVLSTARVVASDNNLQVEYGRFERSGASTQLKISARGDAAGQVNISVEGQFFERFSLENLNPQPSETQNYAAGQRMTFNTAPGQLAVIYLSARPTRPGLARTTIGRADQRLSFTQFVYP
ncbi:MAG: hypothetical protein V7756_01470 [Halopseudomonas sp.]|uniref:hypothetical protein n=1 Tax=Halopseudomonas sp. TaxID=2901191 RepID=UPI00300251A8